MYCSNCGEKLPEGSKFCGSCGNNTSEDKNVGSSKSSKSTKSSGINYIKIGVPIAILLILVISFIGIRSVTTSSPEKTVNNFFKAIETNDVDKMKEIMYFEDGEYVSDSEWTSVLADMNIGLIDEFGLDWNKNVEVRTLSDNSMEAIVLVVIENEIGEIESDDVELTKLGSDWKIIDTSFDY